MKVSIKNVLVRYCNVAYNGCLSVVIWVIFLVGVRKTTIIRKCKMYHISSITFLFAFLKNTAFSRILKFWMRSRNLLVCSCYALENSKCSFFASVKENFFHRSEKFFFSKLMSYFGFWKIQWTKKADIVFLFKFTFFESALSFSLLAFLWGEKFLSSSNC